MGAVDTATLEAVSFRLADELAALRRRIAALEAGEAKGIRWAGRWDAAGSYERGAMVAHSGSVWIADRETTATPGASGDWQRLIRQDRRAGWSDGDD